MQEKQANPEIVETVLEHCRHPECIYRSQIDGGQTPICFYAVLAGELRGCRISDCDKYKDGRRVRPRMREDFEIWWECEFYDEDADFIWQGHLQDEIQ